MADVTAESATVDPTVTAVPSAEHVEKPEEADTKVESTGAEEKPSAASEPISADTVAANNVKLESEANGSNGAAEHDVQDEKPTKTESSTEETKETDSKDATQPKSDRPKGGKDDGLNKYRTHGNKHRGNQFDPTVQSKTDDPDEIRKQVEFYFSDHNLARDKFLYNKIGGTKNVPVPIKMIHSFKRMVRFEPFEAVIKALKDSKALEVTDDEMVKRREPLPEEFENKTHEEITEIVENKSMARSVYVKGFGLEKPTTQFDLEAYFSEFGPTHGVRLRRADDHSFKGSVFVEFKNEETAKAFLEQKPEPTYDGRDLRVLSKKAYCDEKVQQIRDGKIQPHVQGRNKRQGKNGGDDARNWNDRRDEDRKNGFRDNRGGRGRGRGGRGRGGRGRGGRDRNDERKAGSDDQENPKKRSREDDGAEGAPEAKKEKVEIESKE